MNKPIFGIIPPIVTPITAEELVDEKGFRALLRHCIQVGMHGIFVAGTNGETMGLTQTQRDNVIQIAIDECQAQLPVLCGVMDTSTKRVIDNIKRLEQMGGTIAVVTPTFYAKHSSSDEFIIHYEEISRQTNIDIMIYNIPAYVGSCLRPEDIFRIAEFDHVIGYKDSGGSLPDFIKCIHHFENTEFVLLQGSSVLGASSMLAGGDGMIPSLAPLFPEIYLNVYKYGSDGNVGETLHWNKLLYMAQEILGYSRSPLAANKCALSLLGYSTKQVIRPINPVTYTEEQLIRKKAKEIYEIAGIPNRF